MGETTLGSKKSIFSFPESLLLRSQEIKNRGFFIKIHFLFEIAGPIVGPVPSTNSPGVRTFVRDFGSNATLGCPEARTRQEAEDVAKVDWFCVGCGEVDEGRRSEAMRTNGQDGSGIERRRHLVRMTQY